MNSIKSQSDDYNVFLEHFSKNRHRIFAYIRSLLPNCHDAEDVFQRCSLLLWKKFDQFDQEREFLPWACGVAFYEVKNFLRVSARDRLRFDQDLISQLAEHRLATLQSTDQRMDALRECLRNLKVVDRELIAAAYNEDQSLAEFAKSKRKALQTLYNRLSILRRKLLACVQRKEEHNYV